MVVCSAVCTGDEGIVIGRIGSRLSLAVIRLMLVFSVPTRKHAAYQLRQIPYFVHKYIFRREVVKEKLYQKEDDYKSESVERGPGQA